MKKTKVLPSQNSHILGMRRREQPWGDMGKEPSRGGHGGGGGWGGTEVLEEEVVAMGGSWCTCSFKFPGGGSPSPPPHYAPLFL